MQPLSLALALLSVAANSWAWRCDGWLIDPGQSLYEVIEKCGAPDFRERRMEWRTRSSPRSSCNSTLSSSAATGSADLQDPIGSFQTGTCVDDTETYSVTIDVLYYDESVPKALHFENGSLRRIEDLWTLRH